MKETSKENLAEVGFKPITSLTFQIFDQPVFGTGREETFIRYIDMYVLGTIQALNLATFTCELIMYCSLFVCKITNQNR